MIAPLLLQASTLFVDINQDPTLLSTEPIFVGAALDRLWVGSRSLNIDSPVLTKSGPGAPLEPFFVSTTPGRALQEAVELPNGRAVLLLRSGFTVPGPTEVWVTDGTEAGTGQLPGIGPVESNLVRLGNRVFFTTEGSPDDVLIATDGTLAGTGPLESLPAPAYPFQDFLGDLHATPTHVYFVRRLSASENELRTLPIGQSVSTPLIQVDDQSWIDTAGAAGNRLVFEWTGSPDPLPVGREPYVSDGTAAGTGVLLDIEPAVNSLPNIIDSDGTTVYFEARTQALGRELWRTDGTPGGTQLVIDLNPGPADGLLPKSKFLGFVPSGVVFAGGNGSGTRLYLTDGTAAGTSQILPDGILQGPSTQSWVTTALGRVWFAGSTAGFPNDGIEPWVTDGTAAGTFQLADLSNTSSFPKLFTEFDGRVHFVADNGSSGTEVFETDGTPTGTFLPNDLTPYPVTRASSPDDFVTASGRAYFSAGTPVPGYFGTVRNWYVTDGVSIQSLTAAPDVAFLDIDPELRVSLGPGLFFSRYVSEGIEPWFTDGTPGGTGPLTPNATAAGTAMTKASEAARLGNRILYTAQTPQHGSELWSTDGTVAGSSLLADLTPGPLGSRLEGLTAAGERLFFTAAKFPDTESGPLLLGISDGTAAGTSLLPESTVPAAVDSLDEMVAFGNGVAFSALLSGLGATPVESVVLSDGTGPGTLLANLPAVASDAETTLAALDAYLIVHTTEGLYALDASGVETQLLATSSAAELELLDSSDRSTWFVRTTGAESQELWVTDGTVFGTVPIGPVGPQWFETAGVFGSDERLLFPGRDPFTGSEPWTATDLPGSAQLRIDAVPGALGTNPIFGARVGDKLIYSGRDIPTWTELHALSITALGGYVAEPYGLGCGISGAPRLELEGEARLGESVAVTLEGAAPFSGLVLYAAGAPLLEPFGNCSLLIDGLLAVGGGATDHTGAGALPYALSNNPYWLGRSLFLQAAVIAPGGPLGGFFELSNGLEVVFGQ